MIELGSLIKVCRPGELPVYIQIVQQISSLIREGILCPGTQIQSSRELARSLSLHRNTVVAAYAELEAQGWIDVTPRKGCFVAPEMPGTVPAPLVKQAGASGMGYPATTGYEIGFEIRDELQVRYPSGAFKYVFNEGFPDVRLTPLNDLLREYRVIGSRKFARDYLSYTAKEGSPRLRAEVVRMLRQTRGLNIGIENVFISKGAQMGMYLAASLLLKPGDSVIVGDPGFFVVTQMFIRLGVNVCRVPVDGEGIDVDAVEAICRTTPVRLIYVIPHHHHPTTVTLSAARRLRLLEIAGAHRIAIIEDDFDFDIHYESHPTLPMASRDAGGSVIYVGTLTKILAPAIRLGFIVAPANLIALLGQHRYVVDLQGDNLLEEAAAELLRSGAVERHLNKIRGLYKERRDLLCAMLAEHLPGIVSFTVPTGGMCLWVRFHGVGTVQVAAEAQRLGLFIRDGKRHNPLGVDLNAICIGFASLNPEELREATTLLIEATLRAISGNVQIVQLNRQIV
ncbi:aminotransferase-like domain-containing protein [Dyadobacter jiangsuensis]|uniref:GntR family transcriptional regulator n=1 Tax=Dyadobacter jiangsuensis TaxID=1591085 RepID=A0A2P8FNH6_9BACT|nr:PLP-dependent aminotransferase family protein [Dyadobacter jiangsuensis]PSL23280.1 GntR family transcriptional regulator [Dyadobacter jiangsuensis]